LAAILYLGYHGNGRHFEFFQPPKLPHTTVDIWAKFGFQVDYDVANLYPSLVCYGGHFESKTAAKIQKSSRFGLSEEFCIWQPFYTLITMATAAILNFFNPQKLPHTTLDIPTKFHEV
jgi:hypothetical protein